jgi:hypothetical protein
MCFSEIHICVCLWETGGTKNFSLEFVKVGGYDFSHPCDGPLDGHLFPKLLLADSDKERSSHLGRGF